jgi:GAF domain-containing protein
MNSNTRNTFAAAGFSLKDWKSRFLSLIMRGTVIFGFILLVPTLFTQTDPIFFVVYALAYIALVAITFAPLPYLVKAWTYIALIFLLGASGLLDTGIWGDARVFFVAAAVMTILLISSEAAIWVVVVSILVSIIAAWFILSGQLPLATEGIWTGNLATWISGIAVILMLDAIFLIGIKRLLESFTDAQAAAAETFKQLDVERTQLEENVELRTRELKYKTTQLEAAAYVARQITDITELQVLLTDIAHTIAEQFNLYHVGIFLLDEGSQHAILQAASSEGGRQMLETGHRLKVGGQGIVGYVTDRAEPRIALDVGADQYFLVNPLLPDTRSEMALPLISRSQVIGALDVQSNQPRAFSAPDIEIMQTLADQLATAIANSRLFGETREVLTQFESLSALRTPEAWRAYIGSRQTAYQYTRTGTRPLAGTALLSQSDKSLKIPLSVRGRDIGVINLSRKQSAPDWTPRERELALEIATQVSLALDNARLLEETAHRAEMERVTSEITSQISSSTIYESILKTAAEELSRALGGPDVLVQIQPGGSKNKQADGQAVGESTK